MTTAITTKIHLEWDAFISHASEDKPTVARPLADLIAGHHLRVWLDESEIAPGDSLRAKIDEGLSKSRFGVVILSRSFLKKSWAVAELNGIFSWEMAGERALIPVWHKVTLQQVLAASPLLSDRLALRTSDGLPQVAAAISELVRREAPSFRPGIPLFTGRMTKQKLMSLPNGAYLLSNEYSPGGTPTFAGPIPAVDAREAFWMRLRESGMSHRRVYVFRSGADYRAHMSARSIHQSRDDV